MAETRPCIGVLAGVNGAGKSSIAGEFLRARGGDYFNPDEWTRALRAADPGLGEGAANAQAWQQGLGRLQAAIRERHDFWFETTLGGKTITDTLLAAPAAGLELRMFYVGLEAVEMHIARVAARVAGGGHAIPADKIRARYRSSRLNLLRLLPVLDELRVFDNSFEARLAQGIAPRPQALLHFKDGKLLQLADPPTVPEWAKPIVAAALGLYAPGQRPA